MGDRLIVTITADVYLKSPAYFNEEERKRALELLDWVDEVHIIDDSTGIPAILEYKPDIYVKGPDYLSRKDPVLIQEENALKSIGGKLIIVEPDIKFSSTKLKNTDGPFADLSAEGHSIEKIEEFIRRAADVDVNIIGETITDSFQIVELDGQSAKSSCPSFAQLDGPSSQIGGAGVIARHLQDFVRKVTLVTNDHQIEKLRFVDKFRNKKHFEVKTIPKRQNPYKSPEPAPMTLIADFGHGFLTGSEPIDIGNNTKIYTMAQTNSSNFGYNLITKWNSLNSSLVCLDRVEGSLLLGKRVENVDVELMENILCRLNTKAVILTMHSHGSVYFDGVRYEVTPGLATRVVDTIGAGDAFFTFASLANFVKFPPKDQLLIGSIAAAINTQWLCNENSITREEFLKTAKVIL